MLRGGWETLIPLFALVIGANVLFRPFAKGAAHPWEAGASRGTGLRAGTARNRLDAPLKITSHLLNRKSMTVNNFVRQLGQSECVPAQLALILSTAARNICVSLEVNDMPEAVLFEREVDHSLDIPIAIETQGDGQLKVESIGGARALQESAFEGCYTCADSSFYLLLVRPKRSPM